MKSLGASFCSGRAKRPQARWKGSLRGAAPELRVLSSSGSSQMVTGASERDSPNPAQAWRLRLTFARSLALFGEAFPTCHWDHSQEALSLLLLLELEEPFAKAECCGCCAVAGTPRLSDPPHCVQRGRNYCQERTQKPCLCGTKQPVSSMPPGFTDMCSYQDYENTFCIFSRTLHGQSIWMKLAAILLGHSENLRSCPSEEQGLQPKATGSEAFQQPPE